MAQPVESTAASTPTVAEVDITAPNPIPQISEPVVAPRVPASAVVDFGEGETAKDVLKRAAEKIEKNAPPKTVPAPTISQPRDDQGRFKAGKQDGKPTALAAAKDKTPTQQPVAAPAPAQASSAPKAESAAPEKIKIGGKEYSVADLEKVLSEKESKPAEPVAAKPAPVSAQPPVQEPEKKGPTAEEIAASEARFIQETAAKIQTDVDTGKLEAILVGGEEGAKALASVLQSVAARAVLETRKGIYGELNPHLSRLQAQLSPLLSNQRELERISMEQAFVSKFPEYGEHLDDARTVAQLLIEKYPSEVEQMSREEFITEVERQTNQILQSNFSRWNKTGTWKEFKKAASAPAPAQTPHVQTTPAQPAQPAVQQPAAPAAPSKPAVRAPSSNSPGTLVGGKPKDWHRGVAASLTD